MKTTLKFVLISSIKAIRNIRTNHTNSEYMADGRFLVDSICLEGLQEPPMVVERDGFMEIVRGHSRMDAIGIISRERPDEYARLFPSDKIRVAIVSGFEPDTKEKDILRLKSDFNRKNLADRYELTLASNALFDADCTEKEVACQLASMLGEVSGKRKQSIADLTEKLAACDDALDRQKIQAEIDTQILEYRRGKVQGLKAYYTNPNIIMDCLFLETYGKLPECYEDGASLPILTQAHVKKLAKQFRSDIESYNKGDLSDKPTKFKPSHNWVELFQSIQREADEKEETKKSEPVKSMSRADIVKPLKDGKIDSNAMEQVIKYHGADKSIDAGIIVNVDKDMQVVEYAKANLADEWQALVNAYETAQRNALAMAVSAETR